MLFVVLPNKFRSIFFRLLLISITTQIHHTTAAVLRDRQHHLLGFQRRQFPTQVRHGLHQDHVLQGGQVVQGVQSEEGGNTGGRALFWR